MAKVKVRCKRSKRCRGRLVLTLVDQRVEGMLHYGRGEAARRVVAAGAPTLEAELYDGSGSLTLVWLGRKRVPGIEVGRVLTATGRLGLREGGRVLYNPRYELSR